MSSPFRQQRMIKFSLTTTLSSMPFLCLHQEYLGIQYLFLRLIKAPYWATLLCPNSLFLSIHKEALAVIHRRHLPCNDFLSLAQNSHLSLSIQVTNLSSLSTSNLYST